MTQKQKDFEYAMVMILIITIIIIICAAALRHVFGEHVAGIVPEQNTQQQYVSHILNEPVPKPTTETEYAVPEFLNQSITGKMEADSVYSE